VPQRGRDWGKAPSPPQGRPEGEPSAVSSAGMRCVERGDGRVRSGRAHPWRGGEWCGQIPGVGYTWRRREGQGCGGETEVEQKDIPLCVFTGLSAWCGRRGLLPPPQHKDRTPRSPSALSLADDSRWSFLCPSRTDGARASWHRATCLGAHDRSMVPTPHSVEHLVCGRSTEQ